VVAFGKGFRRRVAISTIAAFALLTASAPAATFPGEAGRSRFFQEAGTDFDRWTGQGEGCVPHYAPRYHRMRMYSPYADPCIRGGYRGGLTYEDVQAIYKDRSGRPTNPRWVLKDAEGHRLYVRYDCHNGTCPQFAADIGSRGWQDSYIERIRNTRARYAGIFIDDVNWHINVGNGSGQFVRPIDRRTGAPMTGRNWRRYMADFLERIEAAFPARQRMINSVWWRAATDLDDPDVRRGVRSATHFEMERGTADTFSFKRFEAMLAYIDRLHALGLGVNLDSSHTGRDRAEFEMAAYFLISTGWDIYGTNYRSCPQPHDRPGCRLGWWNAYATDLGAPTEERSVRLDGIHQRRFQRGLVLLNQPGAATRTVSLPLGLYRTLDGVPVTSVTLPGGTAAVLRSGI
jgi:hypothetical protein